LNEVLVDHMKLADAGVSQNALAAWPRSGFDAAQIIE